MLSVAGCHGAGSLRLYRHDEHGLAVFCLCPSGALALLSVEALQVFDVGRIHGQQEIAVEGMHLVVDIFDGGEARQVDLKVQVVHFH